MSDFGNPPTTPVPVPEPRPGAKRRAAQLEDVASLGVLELRKTQEGLLASIAISLKRIADAMEHMAVWAEIRK